MCRWTKTRSVNISLNHDSTVSFLLFPYVLKKHSSAIPVLLWVPVTQSLFCFKSFLYFCLFFWLWCCLYFYYLQLLITTFGIFWLFLKQIWKTASTKKNDIIYVKPNMQVKYKLLTPRCAFIFWGSLLTISISPPDILMDV